MAKAEYRSAIRSRKLIQSALADLLLEKPLDKVTVTDVVNRAQINRSTFYAHYENIPNVMEHWMADTFSAICNALPQGSCSLEETAAALLVQVQQLLEEDLDFYRKIMASGAASMVQEQLVAAMVDYLLQRQYSGDPERYALSIRFCAGGLGVLYRDWLAGKLPYTLGELTQRAQGLLHAFFRSVPENIA